MLLHIFTVFDSKAEAYLPPFYMGTKAQAVRAFTDSANDPNHAFHKHPDDYTLFNLGKFDDATAQVHMLKTPVSMGLALEFKTQREMFDEDGHLRLVDAKVDMRGGVS